MENIKFKAEQREKTGGLSSKQSIYDDRKIPGELLCEGFGEFLRGQCSGHIVVKQFLEDRMIQRK